MLRSCSELLQGIARPVWTAHTYDSHPRSPSALFNYCAVQQALEKGCKLRPAWIVGWQAAKWHYYIMHTVEELDSSVRGTKTSLTAMAHVHTLKVQPWSAKNATIVAVLRECSQEPLQFFWFRASIRFFNSMLWFQQWDSLYVVCWRQICILLLLIVLAGLLKSRMRSMDCKVVQCSNRKCWELHRFPCKSSFAICVSDM